MKRFRWVSICLFLTAVQFLNGQEVKVTAAHVNLRAAPNATSEVAGQVKKGDLLTVQRVEGEWLAVVPPPTVDLWVYGELMRDGVASASKVLVRSGPGINYRDVGRVEQGTKVAVKGSSSSGEWLKIAAPPGCLLWISRKYTESASSKPGTVTAVSTEELRPVPAASEPSAQATAVTAGKAPQSKPDVLTGFKLADARAQGGKAQYEGILGKAGFAWKRPSQYRIVRTDSKGHIISACYVVGNSQQLASLQGKNLLVYGPEYHLEGALYPVVVVEQIVLRD